jgi:hypothetical protein
MQPSRHARLILMNRTLSPAPACAHRAIMLLIAGFALGVVYFVHHGMPL